MKAKKIVRVLLLLVLISGIAGGIAFYLRNTKQTSNSLIIYGNVDIRQIQLAFHDTGRILKLLVDEGATVSAGQLVAEIDPSLFNAAVEQAQGNNLSAEANLQKAVIVSEDAGDG